MGDVSRGELELLLLACVRDEPAHGYSIIEELKRRSRGELELAESTIYPALHRLETDGALTSDWGEVGGRRRRVYRITRRGKTLLGERETAWERMNTAVRRVIGEQPA